jgi:SAM-dependent methyltransferase
MFWDNEYAANERLWGEGPSELAIAAVAYLKKHMPNDAIRAILDIGCGYGRDAFYLLDNLRCRILGIDISENAIAIASSTALEKQYKNVDFQCRDFRELDESKCDIVFLSNVYQLLERKEREELRRTVLRKLRRNGLLFVSTLSVNDPEHWGKGNPVPKESNSFHEQVYLHLCTREELLEDFSFLSIKDLYEHEYDEPRATGEVHHHISWMLIGENAGASLQTE